MSQGTFQQPPRSYTPVHQQPSGDNFLPPAKRQRLDSAPASPYNSAPETPYAPTPGFSNGSLTNGLTPQRQPNGISTPMQMQSNGLQSPRTGAMGPPQRPADRATEKQEEKPERHLDVNELSDLVTASGIDLREEENYLAASYRNNTSFASQTSGVAQTSFDLVSQNSFGAIGSQRGFATSQPTSQASIEKELYDKHKKAARAVNESQQYHLVDPFLHGNCMRHRMEKIVNDHGVRIPIEGLYDRVPVPDRPSSISGTSMTSADGSGALVATAPSILQRGFSLDPILSLLSLAANERVRGLLEDAYGLARNRQYSSDGVVDPEWSDLAVAEGAQSTTAVPRSVSQTAWDAVNGVDSPVAVKEEPSTLPSPPISQPERPPQESTSEPVPTISASTSTSITRALTDLASRERAAEEARRKLRAIRTSKKAAQAAAPVSTTPDSANPPGTPIGDGKLPAGMLGEKAPEIKMTKKEREKLAKQDISDEVATRNANAMASLQLAGMGKSYSWLKGGSGGSTPKPPGAAMRALMAKNAAVTGTPAVGGAAKAQQQAPQVQDRKFGEYRENGVDGKGIQLRDWVATLELDGRERGTLGWTMMKMGAKPTAPGTGPATPGQP